MSIGESLSGYMNGRHVKEHRRADRLRTVGKVALLLVAILVGYGVASL